MNDGRPRNKIIYPRGCNSSVNAGARNSPYSALAYLPAGCVCVCVHACVVTLQSQEVEL